jgi:serine/threonine protein kinase
MASTKRAFGELNSDGIIIPADQLIFDKHIASGSFGRVVQGTIKGTDTKVAIKQLNDDVGSTELKNEVTLLAHLQHPHILVFHGLASSDYTRDMFMARQWYIITEYCPATLEQIFMLTEFTAGDFIHFSLQMCEAMQFLHHVKRIAHRDLKVSGLLIDCE